MSAAGWSLSFLSPATVVLGIAALAALLYALQRLRVRHREVEVVTTLFWRQAVEETRARVLVQRFRYPWIYALILAILALLWSAIAGPRYSRPASREHVLLVDASAASARGDFLAKAIAAARARAEDLPRGATRIFVVGSRTELALDRGESVRAFERRMEGRSVDVCPSAAERVALAMGARMAAAAGSEAEEAPPYSIEIFSALPHDPAFDRVTLATLRKGDAIRFPLSGGSQETGETGGKGENSSGNDPADGRDSGNAGITALGVAEAQSGAWDLVDVYCAIDGVRARVDAFASSIHVTLDGAPRPADSVVRGESGQLEFRLRDVSARGGLVEVTIDGPDANPLDDAAAVRLPDRPPIRVALAPDSPPIVRDVLAADPGIEIVGDGDGADVAVRTSRGDLPPDPGGIPSLDLVGVAAAPGADSANASDPVIPRTPAFLIRSDRVTDPERDVRDVFRALGLGDVDATDLGDLADSVGAPVELVIEEADARGIAIWAALLDSRYDFRGSRAFPAFFSRAIRWLARVEPLVEVAAVGDLAVARAGRAGVAERFEIAEGVFDPVAADFHWPRAGEVRSGRGARTISLLDRRVASAATPRADPEIANGDESTPWWRFGDVDLVTPLVLAALAMLAFEWWLVRKERAP